MASNDDHSRARTPSTTGAGSHHERHETPSMASESPGSHKLDTDVGSLPSTPTAFGRESDGESTLSGSDGDGPGRRKRRPKPRRSSKQTDDGADTAHDAPTSSLDGSSQRSSPSERGGHGRKPHSHHRRPHHHGAAASPYSDEEGKADVDDGSEYSPSNGSYSEVESSILTSKGEYESKRHPGRHGGGDGRGRRGGGGEKGGRRDHFPSHDHDYHDDDDDDDDDESEYGRRGRHGGGKGGRRRDGRGKGSDGTYSEATTSDGASSAIPHSEWDRPDSAPSDDDGIPIDHRHHHDDGYAPRSGGTHGGSTAESAIGDILNLDYSPVTAALPSAMKVPLRQQRGKTLVRLAIGIPVHDEEAADLSATLNGVVSSLAQLEKDFDLIPEETIIVIMLDGIDEASTSTMLYLRSLGLFADDLMIEEVRAPRGAAAGVIDDEVLRDPTTGEKHVVVGRSVTLHLFERCVPIPARGKKLASVDEEAIAGAAATTTPDGPAVPMLLAIKSKNGGLLSSHFWFFEGICRQLHPQYVCLVENGVIPSSGALHRLIHTMERHANVGAVAGQVVPHGFRFWDPLHGAMAFRDKLDQQLYRSAESLAGMVTRVRGSFSAYRWEALRGDPMDRYHSLESKPPALNGPMMASVRAAWEHVLPFEVMMQKGKDWVVDYDPGATASHATPYSLNEYLHRLRKHTHGEIAASLWTFSSSMRIWKTSHSIIRKCLFTLHSLFRLGLLIISWFTPALFFLANLIILLKTVEHALVPPQYTAIVLFTTILFYVFLFIIQFASALTDEIGRLGITIDIIAGLWGIVMFIVLILSVILASYYNELFVLIGLVTYVATLFLTSIFHLEPFRIFWWLPYSLFTAPVDANMVPAFSLSFMHSIDWATRPGHTNNLIIQNRKQEAALAVEDASRLSWSIQRLATATREHILDVESRGYLITEPSTSADSRAYSESSEAHHRHRATPHHHPYDHHYESSAGTRESEYYDDDDDDDASVVSSYKEEVESYLSSSRHSSKSRRGHGPVLRSRRGKGKQHRPHHQKSVYVGYDASDAESFISSSVSRSEASNHHHTKRERRYRRQLDTFMRAIRQADDVRAARLRAADDAERQAKAREFDVAHLHGRFNNFRLRAITVWFLSNILAASILLVFLSLDNLLIFITSTILYSMGIPLIGVILVQTLRCCRFCMRGFCLCCYVNDERFNYPKRRCCCRPHSYFDRDAEWQHDAEVRREDPIKPMVDEISQAEGDDLEEDHHYEDEDDESDVF